MYRYSDEDKKLVRERVAQFRGQVARRLTNELSETEFRPLRLMNGLYLQLHAYMLRVAIPYGSLTSQQLRQLAHISNRYDRGYGHFTTRQNIQLNWLQLEDVPEVLAALADVDMHAIQTSGNCIRNVTADPLAGVAADEVEDARVYAEIVRQWSTLHPEFAYLPRKFKIAFSAAKTDRALLRSHDIALRLYENDTGETGFEVMVGGGQGRTPILAPTIRAFLPKQDLLSYLEAILRIYNQLGRRDNIYKARIKILVKDLGAAEFARRVEEEWRLIKDGPLKLQGETITRIQDDFTPPIYEILSDNDVNLDEASLKDAAFTHWLRTNITAHKQPGYRIVTISLKGTGDIPGDATAEQMQGIANIADTYGFGEIRVTQKQNLVLPDIRLRDLYLVWQELTRLNLTAANAGLLTDIVACPGLDYCNLANARSIPIAQQLSDRLNDPDRLADLGPISLNISGCINSCAQHHTSNIGILGVDKKGAEAYQITLGGGSETHDAIGRVLGPAIDPDAVVPAVETILDHYTDQRRPEESFAQTVDRLGLTSFKEKVYATL